MRPWYRAARAASAVAAAFTAVVLALLVINAMLARAADPIAPSRIDQLTVQLNVNPTDVALRQRIRAEDLRIRRDYFRSRRFAVTGAFLLIGGLAGFLAFLEMARRLKPEPLEPNPEASQDAWIAGASAQRGVAVLATLLGGVLTTTAVLSRHDTAAAYATAATRKSQQPSAAQVAGPEATPAQPAVPGPEPLQGGLGTTPAVPGGTELVPLPIGGGPSAPPPAAPPSPGPSPTVGPAYPSAWADEWPGFRGPGGVGVAPARSFPTEWDLPAGKGLLWKAPVPLPGWNSPIVWGKRVFVSGATAVKREVYAFDADTGKPLWTRDVPMMPGSGPMKQANDAGFAPATMATDGERVFAIYVNADVACFDLGGKPLWQRALGGPDNPYGHSSSLRIAAGSLIVQLDQGSAPTDGKSALLALDPATGKTRWQTKRAVQTAWSTPIALRVAGREVVVAAGNPLVAAYDAKTGKQIWTASCLSGEVAPSPAFGGGLIFTANMGSYLTALRPDTGAVVWSSSDVMMPDTSSPLAAGDLLFLSAPDGTVTCVDAKTGKAVWEHAFPTPARSSMALLGDRVLLFDNAGVGRFFPAAREFKLLGENPLGEAVGASPAFVGGRMFVRGEKRLFCIGAQ